MKFLAQKWLQIELNFTETSFMFMIMVGPRQKEKKKTSVFKIRKKFLKQNSKKITLKSKNLFLFFGLWLLCETQ